ncbi:MAG: tRNA (guanosine(37)-N1)-methyltransferase TrmD [Actinomycetota bacterium]|nr:tRNA (guanosine(37)-N1)-methyltransferase TrmD [Actinomycetota bacterium]MEC8119744.1 tRNA (guanosine(37)-N1)-methyltransferase TrmD [Actinomycetota bacterium]MEC8334499.1 tRNA (guanosine(37)-N1)-methyltransferase TrmD [Actinomycetota bacterium]MEE3072884.1 tRNA (guanosine(37)-N1)-methyltransferase TrmD [Actinomycetota bacterium]
MRIDILTIFPSLINSFVTESLIGKAQESGTLEISALDLREGASGAHKAVDDTPYGGGPGMVLKPEPIFNIVETKNPPRPLYLLSPAGEPFSHSKAKDLSKLDGFSLLCGRYEGVDQRVRDHLIDGEISLGDFVLAGGEIAALAIVETVTRLIPGVMGNLESAASESFTQGLLEYPQYTRPWEYKGLTPPNILRSGNHKEIKLWKKAKALEITVSNRPDLIEKRGGLTDEEQSLLEKKFT